MDEFAALIRSYQASGCHGAALYSTPSPVAAFRTTARLRRNLIEDEMLPRDRRGVILESSAYSRAQWDSHSRRAGSHVGPTDSRRTLPTRHRRLCRCVCSGGSEAIAGTKLWNDWQMLVNAALEANDEYVRSLRRPRY